jgi:hypothetical protein
MIAPTRRWLLAPLAALVLGVSWLTPWPLVAASASGAVVSACLAFAGRGRARVWCVNAASLCAVLLVAELLARSRAFVAEQRVSGLVTPADLTPGVLPLLVSVAPGPPHSARQAPRVAGAWAETVDAAGLTVRTMGSLYAGPQDPRHWLIPGAVVRVSKLHEGEVIYDVVQTISPAGFRVTPPEPAGPPSVKGSVLFFGCSYTFGEGVQDDETLPAQFQRLSGGRWRALNFGVPGAGAHELLTILEEGRERSTLLEEAPPVLAIYTALGDHPLRAVGGAGTWQAGRPRYELIDGLATRAGSFGDALHPLAPAPSGGDDGACRSALLCRLLSGVGVASRVSPASLELWRALVRRSSTLLRERYGIPLVTVVWANGSGDAAALERALAADRSPAASTRTLIAVGDPALRLPFDEHPNARAHALVAGALLDRVDDRSLPGLQREQGLR